MQNPSRNALCPCGSGEKYKRCCGAVGVPAGARSAPELYQQGVQLLRAGQVPPAIPLLLAAIAADENHFDAHHALGNAMLQSARFAEASAILLRAVALRPGAAAAHWDLGAAYDHQGLHEQAIGAYQRTVALAPALGDVQLRLGQLYAVYGRDREAADCLDRAADAKPNTTQACLCRADAQMLRGDMPAAEQWARQAVGLEPANGAAQGGLAGILYNQGRFEDAAAHFEAALKLDPKTGKNWDGLVHCRKYSGADDKIADRMVGVLQRADLHDTDRMTIQFAIGKVYDDRGDYAHAMERFDAANRLRGRGLAFDRAGLAALVDRNIQVFTPDFMESCVPYVVPDEKPLFIVGMYRSGTTLVEQILSSHPFVAAGGELTLWGPADLEVDAATGVFDPQRAQAAIAAYLNRIGKIGASAKRVTDKLPPNFLRLGAIHALMPHARIIHCRRDPIDTCLSIYSTLFGAPVPFAASKNDLVFYYTEYSRMMDHWRRVLPAGNFLEIQYEELIADRDAQTRRMVGFSGLDWNGNCLQPEQNQRAISTSSAWQARQPVYASSTQRWRRYEPWLGELRTLKEGVLF